MLLIPFAANTRAIVWMASLL